MPARILAGAMCVQRFDDSLDSAIHITYRISLRSSSMPEPRDPLWKVLLIWFLPLRIYFPLKTEEFGAAGGARLARPACRRARAGKPVHDRKQDRRSNAAMGNVRKGWSAKS